MRKLTWIFVVVAFIMSLSISLWAANTKNYFTPPVGGSKDNIFVIGGTQNVASGGTLTIASGGTLAGAGTLTFTSGTGLTVTYGISAGSITVTSIIIGANTITTTEWGFLDGLDQAVKTTSQPTFGNLNLTYGVAAATGIFSGACQASTLNSGQGAYELYAMNQDVQTTSRPTFSNLVLTYGVSAATGVFSGALSGAGITGTSFVIGANTLDTNEWAYLDGTDQALKTTSRLTFSNLNLTYGVSAATGVFSGALSGAGITGTSFIIGGNTLDTNEWAFLDGQDQALKTTSFPTLGNLTLTYGVAAVTGTFSGAMKALSFDIGVNSLTTTEWGYLDGINQALKTTDIPTFNSATLTYGMTAATITVTGTLSVPGTQAISSSGGLTLTYGIAAATGVFSGAVSAGSLSTGGDLTVTGADITLSTLKCITGDAAGTQLGAGFEVVINTNAVVLGQTYAVGAIACDSTVDGTYFSASGGKVVYYDSVNTYQRNGHGIIMASLTNGTSIQFHPSTMGKIMSFDIIAGTYSVRGSVAANGTPTLTVAGTCAEAGTSAGAVGKINIVDQGANSVIENNTGATQYFIVDQKWIDTP